MKYGCIGEHLSHSYSKEIHALLGNPDYSLTELSPEECRHFFARRDFCGVNVTIPYKQFVLPFLDETDESVRRTGAVNTVVNRDGRLIGFNTDLDGMTALIAKSGISLAGKKVLILGSGGTSLTAAAVAADLGAALAIRVSRTAKPGCISYDDAAFRHADAEIIINATPCGMFPQSGEMPIDPENFPKLCGVIDAIYHPLRSRLVLRAKEKGIPAVGGLYMLVAQAAKAHERFFEQAVPPETVNRIFCETENRKRNLVLIGMPGSGKTTLGKALAARYKRPFFDTDAEIEKRTGKTVPEWIRAAGEMKFRALEKEAVEAAALQRGCVIATGGGTVTDPENAARLAENGKIYFLDCPPEQLPVTADRPLIPDRAALGRIYKARLPVYRASADETVVRGAFDSNLNQIGKDFFDENFNR